MIPRLTCSLGQHGRVQKSLVLKTGKAEYNPCHGQANALVSSHVFLCDTHRREKTICPWRPVSSSFAARSQLSCQLAKGGRGWCRRLSSGALPFLTRKLRHHRGIWMMPCFFLQCVHSTNNSTGALSWGLPVVCLSHCAGAHKPLCWIMGRQSLTHTHYFYAYKFFPNKSYF